MRRAALGVAGSVVAALGLTALQAPALATPAPNDVTPQTVKPERRGEPQLTNPLAEKQFELRQQALHDVLRGKADVKKINGSKVVRVGKAPEDSSGKAKSDGRKRPQAVAPQDRQTAAQQKEVQYVELAREDIDKIFTIIAEFGNERHPLYPDLNPDTRPNPAEVFDGPLHNQIEKPDRTKDNVTIWQENYDRQHYLDLYFGDGPHSMKSYYEKQSSGRYSIEGTVTDWVKVPYNEARYGRNAAYDDQGNPICGREDGDESEEVICRNTWELIRDAAQKWVEKQQAAGKSTAEIRATLSEYDKWDRYDHDGDGDFNEPDGYIDHFQIIHAGQGEAVGGGAQGEDAIWSHRWYAYYINQGQTGPDFNQLGGTEIGDTGIWIGDYTMQPENGGLGVFAHEYGHDLGLPDLYDTSYLGESSVAFWGLMSSGSYLGPGKESLGTVPGDLLAWSKLQLGWLNYEVAHRGIKQDIKLGPAEYNSRLPQAAVITLPQRKKTVELADPPEGKKAWWSTQGDNLRTSMTREFTIPEASQAKLSLQTWYQIEKDFDYAYIQASTDGGESWVDLTEPITGSSEGAWVPVETDMSPYAGQTVKFRVRYVTDGAVVEKGILVDDIVLTADGETIFSGGAEDGANGWQLDGFKATTGTEVSYHPAYYIASNREYVSYDKGLRTGPYNFGFPNRPNWVEHFPYQDGVLLSYWNSAQNDNNVGEHPGNGLILPIDAHPHPLQGPGGEFWRTRIQVYDATFGLQDTDEFVLHKGNKRDHFRSRAGQPYFDDDKRYWFRPKPDSGVKLPDTGTEMRVDQEDGRTATITVDTRPFEDLGR